MLNDPFFAIPNCIKMSHWNELVVLLRGRKSPTHHTFYSSCPLSLNMISHHCHTHTKHVWRIAQASWARDKKNILQQMERDETRSDKFTQPEIYFHFSSRRLGNVAHLHARETWMMWVRRAEEDKVGAWEFFFSFSPGNGGWWFFVHNEICLCVARNLLLSSSKQFSRTGGRKPSHDSHTQSTCLYVVIYDEPWWT